MDYLIKGYLNNYGFCVKKEKLDKSILKILRVYFSVKPDLNYENEKISEKDKYFDVYYEDDVYIVLPKFSTNIKINIAKFNNKNKLTIKDQDYLIIKFKIKKFKYSKLSTKFKFNGKLRDYQETIINEILKKFSLNHIINPDFTINPIDHNNSQTFPKGGLIKLSCGGGKCLGFNTPVMMFDGSVKMVQDIKQGEILMGDDSTPRNVLSLARGREQMYKVCQENGDSYIVNSSHILSLYNPKKKQIVDISIKDYLCLKNVCMAPDGTTLSRDSIKKYMVKGGLYGFKAKVNFESKPIEINPYLVGLALGKKFSNLQKNSSDLSIFIDKYDLNNYPHIPLNYKANSQIIQLTVLAGLIDMIGIADKISSIYILTIDIYQLLNDIIFICVSCGIDYLVSYPDLINELDFKLTIYGEKIYDIPVKNTDKKLFKNAFDIFEFSNQNINSNIYQFYKINVIPLQEDDYYGFEIDGNKRFLLGDFTVTHNTMLAIYLSHILGLKTLVVTHKEFLMDQWENRIKQFTNAKIGRIRQNLIDVENKDIVIGMLRSLSTKDYPKEILEQFGLVIYDEVHHTGSRVDSQALLKTSAEYTIGLSATPERSDGTHKVIHWHVGDILYEMEKKYNYRVLVKKIYFRSNDPGFKEKKMYFQGRFAPNHTLMTSNLINIKTRNQLIANIIDVLKGMGRKILILSYRVEHLETLKNMVDEKITADGEAHIYNSYYYMGKTKRGEKELAEKDGHIIFATMQLAEEGLDISHLDTVIFALPVSIQKDKKNKGKIKSSKALIQSIGRILRNDKLEDLTQIPMVVDISDMFSIYNGWSGKRDEIYIKKNWYIQHFHWEDLEYINKPNDDIKKNPLNLIFDDITDEDFIEKNLMVTEEQAKKISEEDKTDEDKTDENKLDEDKTYDENKLDEDKTYDDDKNKKKENITKYDDLDNKNKSSKKKYSKQKNDLENIVEPNITYGFGKSKY